jgi:hypothetical protein
VPKPQDLKSRSAQANGAKRKNRPPHTTQKQLHAVDLADVPIEDPCCEIGLIKNGDVFRLLEHLNVTSVKLPQDLETRIIEIYRRCYEQEPDPEKRDESIIRDFVAAFPGLIFRAKWLRKLVDTQTRMGDFGPKKLRSRVLLAMANGFRRAEALTGYKRFLKQSAANAAKTVRKNILKELEKWARPLKRRIVEVDPPWSAKVTARRANKKVAQFVKLYPRLEPYKVSLEKLLQQGKLYAASVLIAAEVFGVSDRPLQRNQESNLR